MKFKDFVKEKMILIVGILLAISSIEILLLAYKVGILVRLYCALIVIFVVVLAILVE